MLKLVAALLCLLAASYDDVRVAWLAEHAVRIRTIDPADDDFRDLEPLRATLAGVRVVMLGEQNHGEGTTFLAKTRLIRFLHERMGFDVLAFESGVYDCAKAWEHLAAGEPAREAVPRGVFAIWTKSREVQPLIDYIGAQVKTKHPLELAGVDNQLTGTASEELLVHDLAAVLGPDLAKGEEWERAVRFIGFLTSSAWEIKSEPVPPAEEQAAFARTIERWRAAVADPFWRQALTSIRVFAEEEWVIEAPNHAGVKAATIRDRQMGKNLLWLAKERYPKRKIIVWAATFHNARNVRTIDTGGDPKTAAFYAGETPMGEVAWQGLGNQLYSLGFISYEGEWARLGMNPKPVPKPSRDSLEDLFARAGFETAFVDFRKGPAWLHAPMAAQIVAHQEMRADWTNVVDGVVFFRKMEMSHKQ